ncbi:MAG: hypothetical protein ACKO9I_22540 [Sphaerospermopsis kisseleviana]|jgi:hypothetical protein|uniref:Uncharacterized protein n=2 Tax=Sphaerospermopsis TaxID=752201 RepID=A0A479ZU56_9CYAN|nr:MULTISPECIES: hypothetical protein [Sphaerospermopsis]MEB3148466.1 hypothetical protein [Sphaerospermopsis sp.]MBC5795869.1 hypothetical protein [Sphaerospermopsis sp. LEGE 00249]MBD2132770.1 hypothetical protein [Sphaerospermopsis sp. FACHB-1094]MBE9235600.1 hypothetical protein [Sphaerospermopsis aphanizomenoides LEGE 00250]GCL35176.1 hypothetical protein SR1949_02680 [Sphaerospermopsis reniformis]
MNKVYTTLELIQILAAERQACLKGERLKLDVTVSGNPVIDQFIPTEGLQKFTAYQDFKASIHEYQRENQVSGIVWKDLTVKGKTFHYPEVDAQLIALNTDLEILKAAKNSMLEFWDQVTTDMDLYLSLSNGRQHEKINTLDVERIAQRTEWASFLKWENANFLELILQMGWGKPEEAAYKRGRPHSGSEFIHAVNPGNYPIG